LKLLLGDCGNYVWAYKLFVYLVTRLMVYVTVSEMPCWKWYIFLFESKSYFAVLILVTLCFPEL